MDIKTRLTGRNNRIFRLRDSGYTLEQISLEIGVSSERIRQIISQRNQQFCLGHKLFYKIFCKYCNIKENYVNKIEQIAKTNLMDEIARLSKQDRRKEIVVQRQALIRLLKDKYDFNFLEIANLLERDHTSIVHLYNQEISI